MNPQNVGPREERNSAKARVCLQSGGAVEGTPSARARACVRHTMMCTHIGARRRAPRDSSSNTRGIRRGGRQFTSIVASASSPLSTVSLSLVDKNPWPSKLSLAVVVQPDTNHSIVVHQANFVALGAACDYARMHARGRHAARVIRSRRAASARATKREATRLSRAETCRRGAREHVRGIIILVCISRSGRAASSYHRRESSVISTPGLAHLCHS